MSAYRAAIACEVEALEAMDEEIGRIKLHTMGIEIDALTEEQEHYAPDYSAGT